MKSLILPVVFVLALAGAQAQEKNYDITVAGVHIGDMTVQKYDSGLLSYYEIKSKVSLWLLFRIKVEYNMISAYRGDQLVSSTSETHSNKGDFKSTTKWNGKYYVVDIDAYKYKKDTTINQPINFNAGKLYFEKPAANQLVYADNFGLLTKPDAHGNSVIVDILGNSNTYYYSGGIMSDAKMYNPLKDFRVTLASDH
ncbi:MAG: DUF6134 family protein [Chryseolinea sp.]